MQTPAVLVPSQTKARRHRRLALWLGSVAVHVALSTTSAYADVVPTFDAAPKSAQQKADINRFHATMDQRLAAFIPNAETRAKLLKRIYREAQLARLPPALVLALIEVESAFRPRAISPAGAVGLMQIMPFWIDELGLAADDLKAPARNLRYGCTILAHYLTVENGDFTRALARYNGSLGKTRYPEHVLNAWQRRWHLASP